MIKNNKKEKLKGILKEKFLKEANEIWKNYDKTNIDLKFEIAKEKEKKFLASVNYKKTARPRSIGRFLVKVPKEVKVIAREDLFDKNEDFVNKIIKHEAIHLGVSGHGKQFHEVAEKVGTFPTENLLQGGGFMVQKKKGNRFKTVKTFPTKEKALDFAKELSKLNKKVRLQY